jgi:LuxR family maltose regulon positive regulatory protein
VLHAGGNAYVAGLVQLAMTTARAATDSPTAGLSERELAVALYLPTPLSAAEIAARLYISLNTLKTHLRAIYRKLGVNGRQQAIERAEELGLA